jgi:nucleotide-binding universal stress UspA family protein
MFEKILLATDGSPHAEEALKYARDLALRDDAQVIVVHAVPPVPAYLGEPRWQELVSRNIVEGEQVAGHAAENLRKAGVEVVVEVLEGPPADAILRVADVRRPDLIVMGSRGHGELASLLLGSASHRVLAHAHVPVMIVRATVEGPTGG